MGQIHIWDRHTCGTDTHIYGTDTHMGQTHMAYKNSLHAKTIFVCGWISSQIVLKPPPWPGDSKSVLRFKIGQWEVGYFCAHTNKQTNIRNYYIDAQLFFGILGT